MELEYLLKTLADNPAKLIQKIKAQKPIIDQEAVDLYNIANHEVMDKAKRPMREVTVSLYHDDGTPKTDQQGNELTTKRYLEVNRIPQPIQKFIVQQRTDMLLADPMDFDASPATDIEKKLFKAITKAWELNKVNFELKQLLTRQMSECEVAVLISTENAEEGYWDGTELQGMKKKFRLNVLKSNGGESLYPVYNQYGDMIAFSRYYTLQDDETGNDIRHFDIYTSEANYYLKQGEGSWIEAKPSESNIDNKIPVVYLPQPFVEWADEQAIIDRKEKLGSNHGESNDRTAFPTVLFRAETIENLPQADDPTKAIQLIGKDSDAKYLESTGAPESVKMEYENLSANIDKFSGTIDFNTLHNFFGSAPSGYAIKLLFQPAHMKAAAKEADFGKGVQRMINLFKSLICGLKKDLAAAKNMSIAPLFKLYLPKNDLEDVTVLSNALKAGLISQETAVKRCPIVKDTEAEWEKVKVEQKEKAKLQPPAATDNLKVA